MSLEIVCSPSSRSFGECYFALDGRFFPAHDWKDEVWFVLEQLLVAAVEWEEQERGMICFQEGPFRIRYRLDGDQIRLDFTREVPHEEFSVVTSKVIFRGAVSTAIDRAFAQSLRAQIKPDTTATFRRYYRLLQEQCIQRSEAVDFERPY